MKGQSKYRVKNSFRKNSNLRPAAIHGRTVCRLSYSDTVGYLSHIQLRTSHAQVKGKKEGKLQTTCSETREPVTSSQSVGTSEKISREN